MLKSIRKILFLLLAGLVLCVSCEKGAASDGSAGPPSGSGGSLARFAVVGNYLYMVDFWDLIVFDLHDPANPVEKKKIFAGFAIETIFPYKDKLYLGAQNGLHIFSLADPENPVKEGEVTHVRACDPVVSNDTVSYVTLRNFGTQCGGNTNALNVYNVKNPKSPTLWRTITMNAPHGLGLKNNALYVCDGSYGLVVFDVTDGYTPVKISEYKDDYFIDVIPYGDILIGYLKEGVCFFEISDPLHPVLLSKLKG